MSHPLDVYCPAPVSRAYNQLMAEPLTALVTTYNEADYIDDCLRSIEWADEIYVIDSYSTDGTVELIRTRFPRVRLEQREYLGAASQKNYAIDRVKNNWILVVDSDERVPASLRDEIRRTLESPACWAYSIGRKNYVLGEEVRYSGLQRDRVTRLFHRQHARYPNRRVHADLVVNSTVGELDEKLLHLYVRSFEHVIEKMTRYGVWGAAQMYLDGETTTPAGIVFHSLWRFVRDYLFNFGFLDGTRGLITVGIHVYYTFWKYARLWELTTLKKEGRPVPLPTLDLDRDRWRMPWEQVDTRNTAQSR